jgi:transposase
MTILAPIHNSSEAQRRYIGLDLHSEEIQLHVTLADGSSLKPVRFATSAANVNQLCSELSPQDAVAMEATTNAFTVARLLKPSGARILVSDQRKTRVIAEAKIKTDKIDARVLSELLRVSYLPEVWLPDEQTEELRHLMSDRQSNVDRRTEVKNRIHAILHRRLLKCANLFDSKEGEALLNDLESEDSPLSVVERDRLKLSREELRHLEQLVAGNDRSIARFIIADSELHHRLNRLLTIPGVSLVVGAGLLAAIGDVTRFKQPKLLASYFGLVPSTYQSGNSEGYHGPITKQGRKQARWLLLEAAEHTVKAPGPLRAFYLRLKKKRNHNVAKTAVARKMAEIIWHLLTKDEDYLYQIPRLTQEKQSRVVFLATGEKARTGPRKGAPQSPLYGTGLKGRQVSTSVAREAATRAEEKYQALVAERAAGRRTHSPEGQCLIQLSGQEQTTLDPLRPQAADWEAEIARINARILSQTPKKEIKRRQAKASVK